MSSTEEEVEFDIEYIATEVQPYMFEPLASSNNVETDEDLSSSSSTDSSSDEYTHRIGNTNWCECGHCVAMTTVRESICCHEEPKTDPKIHGDHLCITEEQEFHMACINETVVRTAMVVFVHDHGAIPDAPETETLRYTAYRQWTAWIHGKLGKKYRLPIPSCAVKEIRKAFPSPSGIYKGFEYAQHL
ncbi:P2X purinoceptor 7-like [Xenia sp. Carnegie-2017]|uniref:P2X purinoceptor 7-like n=1 Tax=Xenia sp. Carnegie-2017 TaxID=2897299 RepID=UPI001F039ABF|nr:P2X purinoceptor 7-like [Xenia sp. Carnegie-2017]